MEVLYLGYQLLFIFDNIINNLIHTKNILKIANINKKLGRQ